jgi:Zn-dependent protease
VAAAGPASNLLLAVAASLTLALLPVSPMTLGEPNVSVPLATLLSNAMRINVLLAVFNMIPIPPLDGGNVLGGLLPPRLAHQFDSVVRPYGFLLLYALMFTRGFEYLVVPPSRLLLSWLQ